jgi:hypothetical protein
VRLAVLVVREVLLVRRVVRGRRIPLHLVVAEPQVIML